METDESDATATHNFKWDKFAIKRLISLGSD